MSAVPARTLLVLSMVVLVFLAPAALVEQNDEAHSVTLTTNGTLLAIAGVLIAVAYAAFLLAWKAYRR